MYIMDSDKKSIVNTDCSYMIYSEDHSVMCAVQGRGFPKYLGCYKSDEEAEAVLSDIFSAINRGDKTYEMPCVGCLELKLELDKAKLKLIEHMDK